MRLENFHLQQHEYLGIITEKTIKRKNIFASDTDKTGQYPANCMFLRITADT